MPTFDNGLAWNTGGVNVTAQQSVSFLVGSGAERHMCVGFMLIAAEPKDLSGVTFNGATLTKREDYLHTTENLLRVQWYDLHAPDSGTHNLLFTPSTSMRIALVIRTYADVDPTTPRGTIATAEGTTNSPSVNASSASGELVTDFVAPSGTVAFTEGGGQVNVRKIETNDCAASSEEAGAGSVTMSWTMDSAQPWVIIAVPLKPAASGPPPVGSLGQFDPELRIAAWF